MNHSSELVDEKTALRILGNIHRSTLWRGVHSGRYPKPVKIGPATNRWLRAELVAVIQKAAAEREDEVA